MALRRAGDTRATVVKLFHYCQSKPGAKPGFFFSTRSPGYSKLRECRALLKGTTRNGDVPNGAKQLADMAARSTQAGPAGRQHGSESIGGSQREVAPVNIVDCHVVAAGVETIVHRTPVQQVVDAERIGPIFRTRVAGIEAQ